MKKNYLLLFFSLIISFFLIEFFLAKFYKQRIYDFDPITGWDLKKNLNTTRYVGSKSNKKAFKIITNKLKLRTLSNMNPKNPCDFDHIFLGDSFVFGSGINIENRFDYLFNEKINSINFGVPGYSILQSYLRKKKYLDKYNCKIPKKLILIVFEEKLNTAINAHTAFRYRPLLIDDEIKLPNTFFVSLHNKLRDLSYFYLFINITYTRFYDKNVYKTRKITPLINEIALIKNEKLYEELLIFFHGFENAEDSVVNLILKHDICKEISCFNTNFSILENKELFIENNNHWNEDGHKFFSNFLINKI